MRIDVDYCYNKAKEAIQSGNKDMALLKLDSMYEELLRLQGVIEALVWDAKHK